MAQKFDALVIGAGQSGPSLAVRLAQAGQRVALVERRGLGGTCVNDGCIPTKTLIASARAAWVARHAAQFGVLIEGEVSVDMKRVKARKDEVVQASIDGLGRWIAGTKGLELISGHARFEGASSLRVGERLLEADRVFLNVGARALVPDIPGLREGPYLTNSSIMDLDALPEHLIILGGSYVGLEFAQMYRRFGSQVTVIERARRLITRDDEDVSAEVLRILELEGIAVHVSATALRVERNGSRVAVVTGAARIEGSHLLVAVGREPNTDDLGIERAGIELDEHGYIRVSDELRTNVPNIWAVGDCNGHGAFTHTSYNDYEIVAGNLLDGNSRRVTDRIPVYGLFVDPPLGRIGMNEAEARASGRRVLVGKRPMTKVGRAKERGETHGFIKIMVDADDQQILGAAILGIEGDEVVHAIADMMYARAPYTVLARAVHAHPTVSELIPTTLQSLRPLS
ncbi:MAG TPA: FAD-containing oxidoreductase [Polyangiaceae bacterium]|nr:FAD-containing oxidoreductase [Polyangiaceae bacterium]